jgi:hypothetical protein
MNLPFTPSTTNGPLPEATAKTQEQWRVYANELLTQIEQLQMEIQELREQRRLLNQMIPIPDDVKQFAELSYEEARAMCAGGPSLEELILEIENEHCQ